MPRQNVFSYSYLGISFAPAKNAKIRGLQKELDNSGNVGTILGNLSKAYDCIPHDVPIAKLELEADDQDKISLNTLFDYLKNCKQRTKIGCSLALGMTLFREYHNDQF